MTTRTGPLSRVRSVIAERMHTSIRESAQLTSVVEADLGEVMRARREHGADFAERYGVSLSPLAVLAVACCRVLTEHRTLNASVDVAAGEASYHEHVNLGIAVDTPAGLMVPNIKDAQSLDLAGMTQAIAELAGRARNGNLRPADIEGGTFTVTNTGSRGSLLDTPILNNGETGILAFGKVTRRPMVLGEPGDERLEIRDAALLCLTYDHRLVDGADAGRFLSALTVELEKGVVE